MAAQFGVLGLEVYRCDHAVRPVRLTTRLGMATNADLLDTLHH